MATPSTVRSTILSTVTELLGLANAEVPNVVALIGILKNAVGTTQTFLDDAAATENAEVTKIEGQLGQPGQTS